MSKPHIAVQMGFVNIEQADFPSANPRKQLLQLFDKGGSTLRVGFVEHLLAFLPTESLSPQDAVQGGAPELVEGCRRSR